MKSVEFGRDPARVSAYVAVGAGFPVSRVFLPLYREDDRFRALSAGITWTAALGRASGGPTGMTRRSELRTPDGVGYVGAGGEVPAAVISSVLRAVHGADLLNPVCFAHWRGHAEYEEPEPDAFVPMIERLGPWKTTDFHVRVRPLRDLAHWSAEANRHFPGYVWSLDGRFSIGMPPYGDSLFVSGGLDTQVLAQEGVEQAEIESDGPLPIEG